MTSTRIVIAQARREFSAAWARASENTTRDARRHLAGEVQRTARRLVELQGGTLGGNGTIDIDRARREFAQHLRTVTAPTPPGADLAAASAESRRIALQLAELEAGDTGTCSYDEETEL